MVCLRRSLGELLLRVRGDWASRERASSALPGSGCPLLRSLPFDKDFRPNSQEERASSASLGSGIPRPPFLQSSV